MTGIKKLAQQKVAKRYLALGTIIDLVLYGTADEEPLDAAFKLIQHYEALFTVNRSDSEILRVNHAAGVNPIQVSSATYALTRMAVLKSREHFGFNAAIGPLVELWHIGFPDARLPRADEINQVMKHIDPEKISLDDQKQTIFLTQKGMALDLGGIAKGYIADRIQDFWHALGFSSGLINLGGNLLLMGEAPHQTDKKWRVGLRNPLNQSRKRIAQIITPASSVVTSGISERQFEQAGKVYHHILDPMTGYPHENDIASITVFSKASIDGELETTRLFFGEHPQKDWLWNPDHLAAVYVTSEKEIQLMGLSENEVIVTDPSFRLVTD